MTLSKEQFGVFKGMMTGLSMSLFGLFFSLALSLKAAHAYFLFFHRFSYLVFALFILAGCLIFPVLKMANYRFFSSKDIQGMGLSKASSDVQLRQALLQNTLEQGLFAFFVYLIWTLISPPIYLNLILFNACLFLVGRILFFVFYHKGAAARSLGFSLTCYPSLLMFVMTLIYILQRCFLYV